MVENLDFYNYSYPDELVALDPLEAQEQANMLVFNNNSNIYHCIGTNKHCWY